MATTAGTTTAGLMAELLEKGHEFSFVQVMRLARRYLDPEGEAGIPGIPWQERVTIRPELSLAFPASDVSKVERDGDNLRITATFLGLYGPSSPLPTFYTEDLMDEASNDESVFRDFLDIIHQRLYHLYFQCWSKYRLLIGVVEERNPADIQRMYSLLGIEEREQAAYLPDAFPLLRYGGLFTLLPRPVSGLETLLRDSLGINRITVIQCVKRTVAIPENQQMRLDIGNNTLDVDAVLGPAVEDRMGKMRIRIGPLSWDDYNSLLPGTPRYEQLARLVDLYLLDPLEVDLELVLGEGEAEHFVMDDPRFVLGCNTFVFDYTMPETSMEFPLASHIPGRESRLPAPDTPPPASTTREFYRRERARIEALAAGYGKKHPLLEPLMTDPSVERLFQGTAFLCALLQMKLDDDLPEIIHDVMRNVQPQNLRPIPSCTIIAFTPKPNCTETHIIAKGTEVASVPVDGTSCRFTTVYPVELHPLSLVEASYSHPPGKAPEITLRMELMGIQLMDWQPHTVRLFLSGEYARAADLYLILTRYLRRIVITPAEGGAPAVLSSSNLKPVGFEADEGLFPGMGDEENGTCCVREFSILPEKFLYFDITGWQEWRGRAEGKRFEVRFELEHPPFTPDRVAKEDFTLFATPAVNVFPHKARPIILCDEETDYPVIPEGDNPKHYEVYSIEKVAGLAEGSVEKVLFSACGSVSVSNPSYREIRNESLICEGYETSISLMLPPKFNHRHITSVYVDLLCTNGRLLERLRVGDISEHTRVSLNFVTFTNCKQVTRSLFDPLGDNRLWKLFGMQFINLKLLTVESLRTVLRLLYISDGQDRRSLERNDRHVEGIQGLHVEACDRIVQQVMKRGWTIRIMLAPEFFYSAGDRYLFGVMLDHFMRGFVSEAYFTRTVIEDVPGGVKYELPTKMGRRALV
ncbi:MAG: type VI secretion system baseplate subunit TssF [Geobacteraceae bacterium]|nr:type VI secretion system baseplate subunit TssF [Geobacteraceae bacterium]